MAGFIEGPVYFEPATTMVTVDIASNQFFRSALLGPFSTMIKTRKVITKVKMPSAMAPLCKSTFKEGPPSMCLYCVGITSNIATAPATAPAACNSSMTIQN